MKISDELRKTYKTLDPERDLFFEIFDEPEGSKILADHEFQLDALVEQHTEKFWEFDKQR